jgi:hypothetical protein
MTMADANDTGRLNHTDPDQLRQGIAAANAGMTAQQAFMAAYNAHPGLGVLAADIVHTPPTVAPVEYVDTEAGSLGQLHGGGAA